MSSEVTGFSMMVCKQCSISMLGRTDLAVLLALTRARALLHHELIDRERIAIQRAQLVAGQPDFATVVVMPASAWIVEPAHGRHAGPALLERRQRYREFAAWEGVQNLIVERIHPVP